MSIEQCKQCYGEGEYYTDGECHECFACKPRKQTLQPVENTGLDPLILAAQEALDVLELLKLGRSQSGRVSKAANVLRQEMQAHLRRQPEREAGCDQQFLRRIVDLTWNSATDSEQVPHTTHADELIEQASRG
jgi:hypothetical protein